LTINGLIFIIWRPLIMNLKYVLPFLCLALACAPGNTGVRYVNVGRLTSPDDSWEPTSLTVAANGRIYVADSSLNCAVQVFDAEGVYLGGIGGVGKAPGELFVPVDVAVGPDGNVYVAEFGTHRISVFSPNGALVKIIGERELVAPLGVAVAPDGNVYVADAEAGGLLTFSPRGVLLDKWGEDRDTSHILDVAVAPDGTVAYGPGDAGDVLLVTPADSEPSHVLIDGNTTTVPNEIAFAPRGELLVLGQRTDAGGALENFVAILSPGGELLEEVPTSLTTPTGVAAAPDGTIYVADGPRHEVRAYRRRAATTSER
jgi:tripartite motif-containing protein 71